VEEKEKTKEEDEEGKKETKQDEKDNEKEKKRDKTKDQIQVEQEQSAFFQKTLPFMQRLALDVETLFPAPTSPSTSTSPSSSSSASSSSTSPTPSSSSPTSLPTLTFGGTSEVTLKQNEIVCLLTHFFFNTYPKVGRGSEEKIGVSKQRRGKGFVRGGERGEFSKHNEMGRKGTK
jgi:hypothetical protein